MVPENDGSQSPLRLIFTFIVVVILPLIVGLYVAPVIVPKPKVGILRLNYEISNFTAFEFREQLTFAQDDPAVKAVVIVINSPGGTASDSEELYQEVLNARQEMPIVSTVDFLAASGAYYIASATDAIYAKPASAIGSIGVIGSLPTEPPFIEEDVITTGPYKAFGGTRDGFIRQVETLKFAFLEAVIAGRQNSLNPISADKNLLSRAEIYDGIRAHELGLIDGVISTSEAIDEAANLAGLREYEVVELFPLTFLNDDDDAALATYQAPPLDLERLWASPSNLPPGLYYQYIAAPSSH